MGYIRCFLSYTKADEEFVEDVAVALQRRGIVPWLAPWEFDTAGPLTQSLRKQIEAHKVVVPFLSEAASRSEWVGFELGEAVELSNDALLPVFLDDPHTVVRSMPVLTRWLTPRGDGVDQRGVDARGAREPEDVADALARMIFARRLTREARGAVVMVDQRGAGRRVGVRRDLLPENLLRLEREPFLVFRPDAQQRSYGHMLAPDAWMSFVDTMVKTIEDHLSLNLPGFELHVYTPAELSLAALIGRRISRSYSGLRLTTHCRSPRLNASPSLSVLMRDHVEDPQTQAIDALPMREGEALPPVVCPQLAVFIGGFADRPKYVTDARDFLDAVSGPPGLWLPLPSRIQGSDDAIQLAARLGGVVQRFGVRHLHAFCAGPDYLLPVVMSLVQKIARVDFYEHMRDAVQSGDQYIVRRLV